MEFGKLSKKHVLSIVFFICLLCVLRGTLHLYGENLTASLSTSKKKFFQEKDETSVTTRSVDDGMSSTQLQTIYLYSPLRTDRSGAAIHDMLMAHAYTFSLNHHPSDAARGATTHYLYGGACNPENLTELKKSNLKSAISIRKELLKNIGLSRVLPIQYDCPNTTITEDEEGMNGVRIIADPPNTYRKDETRFFTKKWRDYIGGQVVVSDMQNTTSSVDIFRIAVHVRRQDVNPCKYPQRYLPNTHYLGLIERYMERAKKDPATANKHIEVEIYSTQQSVEPWTPFEERGYQMHLDTPLETVWRGLMKADVAILSKSSFSYVPAILNQNGTVVYTPFWHKPLPHWEIVDNAFMEQTDQTLRSLVNACS